MAKWCLTHLLEVRAPEMAAALAFRTLFGLIPVLFVATLVTRSLLGDGFPKFVSSLVEMTGLHSVGGPADAAATASANGTAAAPTPLSTWIEGVVAFTGTLNFAGIGIVGVAVVLFSAVWLIVSIEETFNIVCRVRSARPWGKRILVYWSALTLGPLVLAAIPFVTGELQVVVSHNALLANAYRIVEPILGFGLLWGLLIFAYSVIPAGRLQWTATLIGALVGAAGLELGRNFLGFYMERAFTVNRLYGSLGFVPLFMFWVYAMWLIVLFGLQAAALADTLLCRETRRRVVFARPALFDPSVAVSAMQWLAVRYAAGQKAHLVGMADAAAIDISVASRLAARLESAGLVHVFPEEGVLIPARPPSTIAMEDVLRIGFAMAAEGRDEPIGSIVGTLQEAQVNSLKGKNFGDVGSTNEPAPTKVC